MDIATLVFVLYMIGTGLAFLAVPTQVMSDVFPDVASGTKEYDIGRVYVEVVGAVSVMCACLTCPGARGKLFSILVMIGVMSKHMSEGLQPPVGAMVTAGVVLLATLYSSLTDNDNSKLGMWLYMFGMGMNCYAFVTNPDDVLMESFPDASEKGRYVGFRLIEAAATLFGMCVLLTCPGPMGRAMAISVLGAFFVWHHVAFGLGPPLPVRVVCGLNVVLQWYSVFNQKGSKKKSA